MNFVLHAYSWQIFLYKSAYSTFLQNLQQRPEEVS